jgi:hypothetical protein
MWCSYMARVVIGAVIVVLVIRGMGSRGTLLFQKRHSDGLSLEDNG